MSSTNRGGKRSEADVYQTPAWVVHRLLEVLWEKLPHTTGNRWLEPCAGHGAIIRAIRGWCSEKHVVAPSWAAVELLEEAKADLAATLTVDDDLWIEDFFSWDKKRRQGANERYDVAFMNPAFSLAEEFIHACRAASDHVLTLERLNFVEGETRFPLMSGAKPDLYILPQRPIFLRADGKPVTDKNGRPATDSITYAWFHFWPGATGLWRLLPLTPAKERRLV